MPNHFITLNVSDRATWEEVRASYRRLARDAHPDRPGGNLARMRQITSAYEAVKTPERLEVYRRKLRAMRAPVSSEGTGFSDPDFFDTDGSLIFSYKFRATMYNALEAEREARTPKRRFAPWRRKGALIVAALHVPYGITHTGPCVRILYPGAISAGLNLIALPKLSYIPDTMALAYDKTSRILDRTFTTQTPHSSISVTAAELGPGFANCALMFDEEPDQAAWLRDHGLI